MVNRNMEVEVLRLSHRLQRDPRISTHCSLVARTFGASKIYYAGDKDKSLELSVSKTVKNWGGKFSIEYTEKPLSLIKKKKKDGYKIIHLTMYGEDKKVKAGKLLVIIGSEKVPMEYYKIADYNIAITNQPHSEVAALAVFLDRLKLKTDFLKAKQKIIPSKSGKKFVS